MLVWICRNDAASNGELIMATATTTTSFETENAKRSAPYLPFRTFLNSLDTFTHGIPPKLDRTVWKSQAGLVQGLIMNTYRFFGLVDDQDGSTEWLDMLVKRTEERPTTLRTLILNQYGPIVDNHDLTKMTQKMLEDEFERHFSATGTTKQKAITFFLKATKYADMALSPFLMNQIRNTAPKKRKAGRSRNTQEDDAQEQGGGVFVIEDSNMSAHSIDLVSGGKMTLAITANPFKMSAKDRAFVFGVIDKLQEYEKESSSNGEEEEEFES
jgi:hypothetical protein